MSELLLPFVSTIVATFIGASAAFVFAMRKASADRRADFRRQQLMEFYSPIAGHARRVRALLAMSKRVLEAKEEGWRDVLAPYDGKFTDRLGDDSKRFRKIIDYENDQTDAELLPAYRQILELFTAKYALNVTASRSCASAWFGWR